MDGRGPPGRAGRDHRDQPCLYGARRDPGDTSDRKIAGRKPRRGTQMRPPLRAAVSDEPGLLYRVTGGNSCHVAEVMQTGLDRVPQSARDAVLARTARLGQQARGVLTMAGHRAAELGSHREAAAQFEREPCGAGIPLRPAALARRAAGVLWDTPGVPGRDSGPAGYEISLQTVAACPTAVVARATSWDEFPRIWRRMLDEVYAFLRSGGAVQDGDNLMLYRDDVPNVEVGVQVAGPFTGAGRVVPSARPAWPRRPCTAGLTTGSARHTRRSWRGAPRTGTGRRAPAGKSTATGGRTPRTGDPGQLPDPPDPLTRRPPAGRVHTIIGCGIFVGWRSRLAPRSRHRAHRSCSVLLRGPGEQDGQHHKSIRILTPFACHFVRVFRYCYLSR